MKFPQFPRFFFPMLLSISSILIAQIFWLGLMPYHSLQAQSSISSAATSSDWPIRGSDSGGSYVNSGEHNLGVASVPRLVQRRQYVFQEDGGAARSSLISSGGIVYIAREHTLYQFTNSLLPVATQPTFTITLKDKPDFNITQLAAADNIIYMSTDVGVIIAFDTQRKKPLWKRDLGKRLNTDMLLAGDALYIVLAEDNVGRPTQKNGVYALNNVSSG